MKRTPLIATLIALFVAASGYGLYLNNTPQRSRPPSSPPQAATPRDTQTPPAQPLQSPPPQAAQRPKETAQQPEDSTGGRNRPPDAPVTGHAEARPPSSPQRPGGPGHGHVGVVPYPGYPWGGYPWYPYPWGWGYPRPEAIVAEWATSYVKLEVSPKDATLHVDGHYAGRVEEFSGLFRNLTLPAGPHVVEIRKPGYYTLVLELNLQPGQTITYKRTMEPVEPGAGVSSEPPLPGEPPAGDPEQFIQIPGDVRFDVTPKDAEVYADGYYAGLTSDFSGSGQHLVLTPGQHHIELRAKGYETVGFDVMIRSGQTVDYRNTLERSR
jgi:hypothetical protein